MQFTIHNNGSTSRDVTGIEFEFRMAGVPITRRVVDCDEVEQEAVAWLMFGHWLASRIGDLPGRSRG
jgi:3-dehydroquinate synthetase